jgi:primosomal protein N' (replication factor Y) (superfamily II helicase)
MAFLIDVAVFPLSSFLSYVVDYGDQVPEVGEKILVPLGKREAFGYICTVHRDNVRAKELESAGIKIKEIGLKTPRFRCFSEELLNFYKWTAEYYGSPLSEVLETAIPTTYSPQTSLCYSLQTDEDVKGKKQKEILCFLKEQATQEAHLPEIVKNISSPHKALKSLVEKGVLVCKSVEREMRSISSSADTWAPKSIVLTDDQEVLFQKIKASINQSTFSSFLLHGVTGSGKTEVYIAATKEALLLGKSVLILVPEIALTPQLVERFRAQLDTSVAVLHSGISQRKRWEAWSSLANGDVRVAIGARSAIFAPIHDLGLVIVDEEHDSSFKQNEGLRYNARDLALARAKLYECCVVLGSATPSLESYWRAKTGKLSLLSLANRPFALSSLKIRLVDLNQLKPWDYASPSLSSELFNEISSALGNKEQIFLLYNRRGYSQCMKCEGCGFVLKCPYCSVSLTFHNSYSDLLCHYCGFRCSPPKMCSEWNKHSRESREEFLLSCKAKNGESPSPMTGVGSGTQKVFEEISELFPHAKVGRLDRDSVKNEQDFRQLMQSVREGEVDILVGTQMLAKGHDLPKVTVVGIIDCDVGIHMPDFRSSERTFQLLTQAAGRAGRAKKEGRVILQTRSPHNSSVRKTLEQDFLGFIEHELDSRRELSYPPFCRLLRIIASSEDEELARSHLESVKVYLQKHHQDLLSQSRILGPTSTPITKIKSRWRYHLLLKSTSATVLVRVAHLIRGIPKKSKNVRVAIDLDPQDML